MLKTIPLSRLQAGMFLVKSGDGSFGNPYMEHNRIVDSPEVLRLLKARLKGSVVIDPDRSHPEAVCPAGSLAEDAGSGGGFSLDEVTRLYAGIVTRMKGVMQEVRKGSGVDVDKAGATAETIAQLALRSPSFLKRVMKLRQFDEYTFAHSTNVCALAVMFGTSLGLDRTGIYHLGLGALLHDVGKMKIPESILNKPGKLTPEEFAVMRQHPVLGYVLLRDNPLVHADVLLMALDHHERIDGTGYPRALAGDAIGRLASIVGMCDMYDAMTTKRVYKPACSPHEAIQTIQTFSGASFPADLVEAFVGCMGIYPEGTWVQLTSGQIGLVIRTNLERQDKPMVRVVADRKWVCCRPVEIDLAAPHSVAGLNIDRVVQPDRLPQAALH